METILLNDEVIMYKTRYNSVYSNDNIVSILEKIIKERKDNKNNAFTLSGKEEGISDIINFGIEQCKAIINQNNLNHNEIWGDFWINKIDKKSLIENKKMYAHSIEDAVYHSHTELNKDLNRYIPNYTFVYYVQMPNNLNNLEGSLLVKNSKEDVYTFHPKENDFIIMKSDTPHCPLGSFNSTKDRIVIAGNIGLFNIKKDKTLI